MKFWNEPWRTSAKSTNQQARLGRPKIKQFLKPVTITSSENIINVNVCYYSTCKLQKQPYGSVLRKRCSENIQHGCSPVNLLHIFRTPFPKNTFGGLFLKLVYIWHLIYIRYSLSAHQFFSSQLHIEFQEQV